MADENLIENVTYTVEDAEVIPTPIDPTLTIPGEAADAKAVGDAIAAVFNGATLNGKPAVNKAFTIYGSEIYVSSEEGASTLNDAIDAAGDKTASDIIYDPTTLTTVAEAISTIATAITEEIPESEIDELFDEVFGEVES